eukprot:TRINITY_DN4699_c0_g1_i1.p1 TRINITY_DN4699_c0_g1~~TRINITY_DN4699_c0_g1_i1.p1  ORF type:complete len:193 (+),score=51.17 TRINITY_DN4699_c0_g1_i1:11-589(+)
MLSLIKNKKLFTPLVRCTTILSVRKNGKVTMISDGQVTSGSTVSKSNAVKVRRFTPNCVGGFAGSVADALTLSEILEKKLEEHPTQLERACCEMAKDWRTNKIMRHLSAEILVSDQETTLLISGNGDVLKMPNVAAIGSGGSYALSAAQALIGIECDLDSEAIADKAMEIAGNICIYTNHNTTKEILDSDEK